MYVFKKDDPHRNEPEPMVVIVREEGGKTWEGYLDEIYRDVAWILRYGQDKPEPVRLECLHVDCPDIPTRAILERRNTSLSVWLEGRLLVLSYGPFYLSDTSENKWTNNQVFFKPEWCKVKVKDDFSGYELEIKIKGAIATFKEEDNAAPAGQNQA